jgi:hypothetical protein
LFEDSVERLDARTRSRLNQARNVALNELKSASSRRYWLAAPWGGLAAAVLVAVFLIVGRETGVRGGESGGLPLDDVDILADVDSFELILDVEFYSWLADENASDRNNSG